MINQYNPLNINQATTSLLPNPLGSFTSTLPQATLCLNQIDNFKPATEFTDDTNLKWQLVKASSDSTVDIPDPKTLQIVDYWNHEFPGIKTKLYVYVVEGIKPPRVETEMPARVLYQWFSTVWVPTFTPQMITEKEWLKANVYAAPVTNSRVSKLKAICHLTDTMNVQTQKEEDKLLKVEEFANGNSGRDTTQN